MLLQLYFLFILELVVACHQIQLIDLLEL